MKTQTQTTVQRRHQRIAHDVSDFLASGGEIKQCQLEDNAFYKEQQTQRKRVKPKAVRYQITHKEVRDIRDLIQQDMPKIKRIAFAQNYAQKNKLSYQAVMRCANFVTYKNVV